MERYMICETTDAFEEPYAIWDNIKEEYFSVDGVVQTFISRQLADEYLAYLLV